MADEKVVLRQGRYYPPDKMSRSAHVKSMEQYRDMYRRSLEDPGGFGL